MVFYVIMLAKEAFGNRGGHIVKQTAIGILAHVDSGKTTLSEALLYCTGNLQKLGRVDHRDSFLDTYALERDRGITIFSKQAVLACDNARYYLLDTPGHVDFSAETERTLQVLDYAILVVSGTDGVQSHTKTLWRLLQKYRVPCFLFVNKMDLPGADKTRLLNNLKGALSDACIDFSDEGSDAFLDPCTWHVPFRRFPPRICQISIDVPPVPMFMPSYAQELILVI